MSRFLLLLTACGTAKSNSLNKEPDRHPNFDDTGALAPETGWPDSGSPPDDGDPVTGAEDCDPSDPTVFPGAPEVCGDNTVNDCLRRAAGWTEELCVVITEPEYRIFGATSYHNEIAALGDLRGDGHTILGIGIPSASMCDPVGIDDWGETIWDCYKVGGAFLLDLEEIEPVRGKVNLADFGSDGIGGVNGLRDHTFGSSLEGIGDFNRDGYSDFVVGNDQLRGSGETDEIWVFWGPDPTTGWKDGTQLFVGTNPDDCAGYDMERAGDLTGDGTIDLIVSDPCINEVWVWSGTEVQTATGPGIRPTARVRYSGPDAVYFGMGINGRGDFDGDGFADLVASAPQPDYEPTPLDFVAVFSGPLNESVEVEEASATIRSPRPRRDGIGHNLGHTLDVGDVNGDGYADLAIADPLRNDPAEPTIGSAVFLFHGPLTEDREDTDADLWVHSFAGSDVQIHTDFDRDGRDDLLVGAGIYPREVAFDTHEGGFDEAYLMFHLGTGRIDARKNADITFRCITALYGCDDWGSQVQAIPDQTGDGVPDVFVGTYGDEFWLMAVPPPRREEVPL